MVALPSTLFKNVFVFCVRKMHLALKDYLPKTYVDYSFYIYVEEYGIIPAGILLLGPPLVVFVLIYFVLRRQNKPLFFVLLAGYLLYNAVYMANGTVTLYKGYLSAALVGIPVLVYWLINKAKPKAGE